VNQTPLVSVVIPTYNREGTVCEAIDSVVGQTYGNVEIIVIDDGSTDETPAALRRYGNRIKAIFQKNAGPSAARNAGISLSSGDFVAFLDSDDLWMPQKLERQIALLHRAGDSVPCCLASIMMAWKDRQVSSFENAGLNPKLEEGLWLNPDEVLLRTSVLFNQGVLVRRSTLCELGGFDRSLRILEDFDLALRLSLKGPWAFIREPLAVWRQSEGSLSGKARENTLAWRVPLVGIFERHAARIKAENRSSALSRQINRELESARRHLRAAELSKSDRPGPSALGHLMRGVEKYRNAVARRMPSFPKMLAEPVHA
jgi:glycosyltransferase involved in cell wall biosynthesis